MGPNTSLCTTAAMRVHNWLEKDKMHFLLSYIDNKKNKMYKYDLLKMPKVSSRIHCLTFPLNRITKEKSSQSRVIIAEKPSQCLMLEPMQCSVKQKYPHQLSEIHKLSSKQIIPWRLKEHLLVCKALRSLIKQAQIRPQQHQITSIESLDKKHSSASYFKSPGTFKEERCFQIDRL